MIQKRIFLVLATGFLLLIGLQVPARAQGTSGIKGLVLDKDGQPIVGATIMISNQALGISSAGGLTDAKGEFRIAPLPPGRGYSVTVSFPNMQKLIMSDIEVGTSKVTSLPVTLRPEAETKEHVKVTAKSEVVNTETTTTSSTYTSEFIDTLPILGKNYQDVLTLAPGVVDVNGTGNPNIHGARDTEVITLVDGVSTTDPYDGKRGQELNIESIQEIEVKTAGASAEFGRAQGGFVNILTKSGGNDFQGSFEFNWQSNILDGDGAGIDSPRLHGGLGEAGLRDLKFNTYRPFLSLAGPIKKDKAWYFFTAEYIQIETPVNALTQAFVRGTKEKRVFGKVTWDPSTNHKVVFTATIDPQELTNEGLDSFRAIESGYTMKQGGTNLLLRETSIFNPNVFLETSVQHLRTQPQRIPTLNPDTNGNGVLFYDRNGNGFMEATERDPGEDFDRDNKFDVFENKITGDRDGDGRVTQPGRGQGTGQWGPLVSPGGCEGAHREDADCDGHLDNIDEDPNHNGICDAGEPCDVDHDGVLEHGTEDRNQNHILDDTPAPTNLYPYGELTPTTRDRDNTFDGNTLRINGPNFFDYTSTRGRETLRQDLTVFVPDWHGQHEMKFGGKVERETYSQDTNLRPFVLDNVGPASVAGRFPKVGVVLPAEMNVANSATSTSFGVYLTDTYKPLPNLTIGFGLRFDREATDSFGYTPFDPVAQRTLFDNIENLAGAELVHGLDDATAGNNDGLKSDGYCTDPIFGDLGNACQGGNPHNNPVVADLANVERVAPARLTQHHISTTLVAHDLAALFPGAIVTDPVTGEQRVDRDLLRQQGAATFQDQQPFRLTNNNLAPRISISWDPFADSKTKIFANWSRFYDKLFLQLVVPEEGPDQISRYYRKDPIGVTGGGVPDNGIGLAISKAPPSTAQVDRGLQTPFTDEFTFGIERELAPEVSLKMTYINRRGRDALQQRDINHVLRYASNGQPLDQYGQFAGGSGGDIGPPSADGKPDLYIENFFFNQILRLGNFNNSQYHGIELQVTKRLSRKWQMDASYTYSRAVGAAEAFDSSFGDATTTALEFGYLSFDIRHAVKFNAVTFLPGDWQLAGVLEWRSGLPYSVTTTFFSVDNFSYPQNRRLFGATPLDGPFDPIQHKRLFAPEQRNDKRNASEYSINLAATKALVLGHINSKLNLAVDNLLNTDDLTIARFEPNQSDRAGGLQLASERRFGRRFRIGFQFDF